MGVFRQSPESDKALVSAFKSGDGNAFDQLVLRHKDKVFNLTYWFLGDYQEANDCAQEAFLKAFKALKKFKGQSTFSTWLFRIGVNTCKNRLKSSAYRWKKRSVPLEAHGGSIKGNPGYGIRDDSPSPADQMEKMERIKAVRSALDALPEDQKKVVILRDIQGLSYEEIAEITGLNLGTVKSRISRGRLGLRDQLVGRI
jgi:RNA polymerase sigma-70 factor (ECF subfamily)